MEIEIDIHFPIFGLCKGSVKTERKQKASRCSGGGRVRCAPHPLMGSLRQPSQCSRPARARGIRQVMEGKGLDGGSREESHNAIEGQPNRSLLLHSDLRFVADTSKRTAF